MPNWVYNKMTFDCSAEKVNAIKDFVRGEDSTFDFNKLILMPEELNLVSGSDETIARSCAVARRAGKKTSDEYEKPWATGRSFEEWADLGEKYLSNIEKYGASTWYDWSWNHWGTKWNASDPWWDDYSVTFNTAWNTPEPIFKKISELFPDAPFHVEFADEDIGSNCGTIDYDDNGFTVEYVNDYEFACNVLGYDPNDFEE